MPRARIPKWQILGISNSRLKRRKLGPCGCATHARQPHAHALGPLRATSCERCRACHPHRRYFVPAVVWCLAPSSLPHQHAVCLWPLAQLILRWLSNSPSCAPAVPHSPMLCWEKQARKRPSYSNRSQTSPISKRSVECEDASCSSNGFTTISTDKISSKTCHYSYFTDKSAIGDCQTTKINRREKVYKHTKSRQSLRR